MKASDLRQKNPVELKELLLDLRKQQFGLRLQHASGTLTQRHEIRQVRRNIAQVKTVLNQLQRQSA
ncbi:MAG: 50S ribosomal protein L29 [Wenzhouxiangella sp.]